MLVHSYQKWQHLAVGVFLSLCLAGSVSAQISGITESESQTNLGGIALDSGNQCSVLLGDQLRLECESSCQQ